MRALTIDEITNPLARPEQLLIDHLSNMLNQLPNIWEKTSPKINFLLNGLSSEEKQHIVHLLLISSIIAHDFGKLAPAFQIKIKGTILSKKERIRSRHIETSAIFARELFFQAISHSRIKMSRETISFLTVIVYYTVLMHHQKVLKNTPSDGFGSEKISQVSAQFAEIFTTYSLEGIVGLYKQLFDKVNFSIGKYLVIENIKSALVTINKNIDNEAFFEDIIDDVDDDYYRMGLENNNIEFVAEIFFLIEFNYSVLCDLDEWDAKFYLENKERSKITFDEKRNTYPKELVELYRAKKLPGWKKTIKEMAAARNITFEILNNINFDDLIGKIRTLTAPTGSAKTLALLNLAFKIRDAVVKRKGVNPKIIYCLPFITITEEVAEVVKEILGLQKTRLQSEELTIHHHLAPIYWNILEDPDEQLQIKKSERDLFFTKLWRSDVIITTFVRFWESILSCKKSEVLRFHRMANSIIIFDEMQAIPTQFWDIIYQALKNLASNYNCTIISATATQPLIVPPQEKKDLIDTHPQAIEHYAKLNRYDLIYYNKLLLIEDFIEKVIINELQQQPPENLMIVLNTKKVATFVSQELESLITEKNLPYHIYFLSRNVLPIDRKKTLELVRKQLQERNSEEKCLLVCTQLVEAGVNISFEKVFRDMAPLSSIIQVAGRCNRAMEQKDKGKVYVYNLMEIKNSRKYIYSQIIYDCIELRKTRELLSQRADGTRDIFFWDEVQLRELGKKYYQEIARIKDTEKCLQYLKGLHYFSLNDNFKLIKELPEETLFIIRNDEAKNILQKIKEQQRKLRAVKYIPQKFYEYIINLPKKDLMFIRTKIKPFPNNKEPAFWILQESNLYDPRWGLRIK